jgi:hypothetical protein
MISQDKKDFIAELRQSRGILCKRAACSLSASITEDVENKKRIAELELSIKDLIEEFAEASCMGDLAKIARNYGYEESKDE